MPKCSLANCESGEQQAENQQPTHNPWLTPALPRSLLAFFEGQQPQQVGKDPLPAASPLHLSPTGTDALYILTIITHSFFIFGEKKKMNCCAFKKKKKATIKRNEAPRYAKGE